MKAAYAMLLLVTSVALGQATLDSLVASQYPTSLTEWSANEGIAEQRSQSYAVVTAGTQSFVVAAYSNGNTAAVRLLQRVGADCKIVDDSTEHFAGSAPEVYLYDVDADGISEAFVTFDVGKGGSETWVFKVNSGKLVLISPKNPAGRTALVYPEVLDVSGNGKLDLIEKINTGSKTEPILTSHRFVLSNGLYVAAEPLDFFEIFYRNSGAPQPTAVSFDIPDTAIARQYRLTVVNGASSGADYRTASGTIKLNGIVVSSPSDFSEQRATWTVPVALQQHNTLTVELGGKPRSRVAVVIRHD